MENSLHYKGLWLKNVDRMFANNVVGMGEWHPSGVVFSIISKWLPQLLFTHILQVSALYANQGGTIDGMQIVLEKSL